MPGHTEQRPAIAWVYRGPDGPSFGWDNAKVACANCDGFTGTACPVDGCGVRLVSTQAEDDERYRREMREQDEERRRRRAQIRAERDARRAA